LVGKLEGKRPLGRYRIRREDNNRMDLKERGLGSVNWIHLPQLGLDLAVMNLRIL
jgi:ABC-type uncharacterized transport system involved in gliding motility auxiliary subunit